MKRSRQNLIGRVGLLLLCFWANSSKANVYATDIKINGSLQTQIIMPGQNTTVSYILNDTASAGVWVRLYSGTNLIGTLSSTNGHAGTNAGSNSVTIAFPTNTPDGAYSVTITAAANGYATWTNITDDSTNFSVSTPRGIAVNQDTNSPYYGRVYVANAWDNGQGQPYDQVGLFKYNADGGPADEGGFSTGGYNWTGDHYSPWKMTVGPDDRLYVNDFNLNSQGVVISFDPVLGSSSSSNVITPENYPPQYSSTVAFSGMTFANFGTNTQFWMSDADPNYDSAGVIGWQFLPGIGVATNDTGVTIIPTSSYVLTQSPYDVAVDRQGDIFVNQFLQYYNPAYALISYPPYAGNEEAGADWVIPWYPSLLQSSGVAADPVAPYVALAVIGACDVESACGGLYLCSATNEDLIADLDTTGGDPYYDVAWDNVGNLYALDGNPTNGLWRVYSPPGSNSATTTAVAQVQVYKTLTPPILSSAVVGVAGISFTLEGQSNVTYIIQASRNFSNWCNVATNFSTNASRPLCVPLCGIQNFYRAVTSATFP